MEEENELEGPAAGSLEADVLDLCHTEHEETTWWQRVRWWFYTRIRRRCWGCGIKMLAEDKEYDPRVVAGTHSTVEQEYDDGRFCYGCVHYPEG